MGFNSVYKCLQELFPQVDSRLLRAVAIEHPKDADLAAGIVLNELIPLMSKKLAPSTPPQDKGIGAAINVEVESDAEGNGLGHRQLVENRDVASSSAPHSISVETIKTADCSFGADLNVALDESTLTKACNSNDATDKFLGMNETKELSNLHNAEDKLTGETSNKIASVTSNGSRQEASEKFEQEQLDVDIDSENMISSGLCKEMEPEQNHLSKDAASTNNNGNRNADHLNEQWIDLAGPSTDDYNATIFGTSHRLGKCETSLIEVEGSEAQAVFHVQGNTPNAKDTLECEFEAVTCSGKGETNDIEDKIGGNNTVNQYSQACRIDLLEEIIEEAKTNKTTLFSSMESLINLMKEVELQEKAAEQARIEASTGGSNILVRVEEYKSMLGHAKEANDMHAGEVYGEKAILATELKELQSRLLSLSDERDKSLAILEEMRQILEARLAAAEELKKAAEHEKMEKEESARKVLAEQEAMVEKVVKESVRLQQEAEENSKLREFLMDRGQVVDMLQGEISVICQDIRLLKQKFDANLPLSKSFTSLQTSCILASSGSSHKSLASDVGSEHSDSSGIRKTSRSASIDALSSKSGHEEERSKADHNDLVDDGWDIFEKDAELNSGVY